MQLSEWADFKYALWEHGHTYTPYRNVTLDMSKRPPDADVVRCPVWDAIQYNDHPGMMCDLDRLNAMQVYQGFEGLLGRNWLTVSGGRVMDEPELWFSRVNAKDKVFIKPARFGKIGGAHVIGLEDVNYYFKRYNILTSETVLIATPISLHSEYRVIVKDGLGITACQYKCEGQMDIRVLDRDFERKLIYWVNWILECGHYATDYSFPLFVLDVGITEEGQWVIIEANSFCSSGFYKCNVSHIVHDVGELFRCK